MDKAAVLECREFMCLTVHPVEIYQRHVAGVLFSREDAVYDHISWLCALTTDVCMRACAC